MSAVVLSPSIYLSVATTYMHDSVLPTYTHTYFSRRFTQKQEIDTKQPNTKSS